MKKAVIFDLDGVITDTALFHFQAWKKLAHQLGLTFTEQDNEKLKGIDRMNSLRLIIKDSDLHFSDDELDELAEQKNKHYQSLIAQMNEQDIFPGVADLIGDLKTRGYLLGVASVSKNADFVLQRLKITHLFDYVADASKIAHSKPDPEIFLTVAENLQVLPANCVGIEDAIAGVSAIKAAGMPAIGVGAADALHEADIVLGETGQISWQMIDQLLAKQA